MAQWGIHNDTLTTELIDEGFVSLGWDGVSDLNTIAGGREGFKQVLTRLFPDTKAQSIAGQAGVLYRFRDEIQIGDMIVAPYKPDSTVNIGEVTSDYYYEAAADTHRHRRRVEWKQTGLSRTVFSQPALYEIGSAISLFRIKKFANEFAAAIGTYAHTPEELAVAIGHATESSQDDGSSDEPSASRIERHTRDFVLNALHRRLSHQEFEEFTASLMRTLGYQARVTQYSNDGGIDVIAHRDPLGVEPPLIKIQCKHITATVSAPEVQQLAGAQGPGELSVFVTLGSYSRDALAIERQRPGLRLLTGEDVVTLVLENYSGLSEKWRTIIPLTKLLVVADNA